HAADERDREQQAELAARADALQLAQMRLESLVANKQIAPEVLAVLRARHDDRFGRLPNPGSDRFDPAAAAANVGWDLIAGERNTTCGLWRGARTTDGARRRRGRDLVPEGGAFARKKEGGVEPPL